MHAGRQSENTVLAGLAAVAGLLVPAALAAGGVWFGIIQRDIVYVAGPSWSTRHTSMDIEGPAAVLTGMAFISMAVALHGWLFWQVGLRRRGIGTGLAAAGTLAFLGLIIAAMATRSAADQGVEGGRPLSEIERFQIQADEELRQRAFQQGKEPPPPLHSEGIHRDE